MNNIPRYPKGSLLGAIQNLLHYSWKDIDYKYEGLTDTERGLVSREDFERLVEWIVASDHTLYGSGDLSDIVSPPNKELLPILVQIYGVDLKDVGHGTGDLADVLHCADWGSVHRVCVVLGDVLMAHPDTEGTVVIRQKATGEVLHILHIEKPPAGTGTVKN